MGQIVKDQHTTPRCYLKNFSDDGVNIYRKFKEIDKEGRKNYELQKPTSLKSATTKPNFYTINSGRDPMLIESRVYSKEIENHYPSLYKLLIDPKIDQLSTMEDRSKLLMFFLSLHCRTPKQFRLLLETIPKEHNYEIEEIKEDYKAYHILKTLPSLIEAHQFKVIKIVKIIDSSEFITSDNPVLFIGSNSELRNHEFREQFNTSNMIIIPLDRKHCCVLFEATDKNGISLNGKLFYNKIERIEETCSFTQQVNFLMLDSADEYYFGSKNYLTGLFNLFKIV